MEDRFQSQDHALRSTRCLVVFTKPAIPGRVKTRLIGELSAEEAARLHAAFLDDLLDEMADGDFDLRIAWALEPGESTPRTAIKGVPQRGRDLGQRLYQGLAELATEFPLVAAVGSDHPHLKASIVQQAFDKLNRGTEIVLGPAGDGGYYLVAVRRSALRSEIFEGVPWSTAAVLETTLARCAELGMHVEFLPTIADVDAPADLDRLVESLAGDPRLRCSRTRRLLYEWQRLPGLPVRGDDNEDS